MGFKHTETVRFHKRVKYVDHLTELAATGHANSERIAHVKLQHTLRSLADLQSKGLVAFRTFHFLRIFALQRYQTVFAIEIDLLALVPNESRTVFKRAHIEISTNQFAVYCGPCVRRKHDQLTRTNSFFKFTGDTEDLKMI